MKQNIIQDIKAVKIIISSMIIGLIFFALVSLYLHLQGSYPSINDKNLTKLLLIIVNIFMVILFPVGIILFKKRMQNIMTLNLKEKIGKFREALIIRSAMFEGVGFFFIVVYLLTGNFIFIIESTLSIIFFLIFFPTKKRIGKEIGINIAELY